MRLASSGDGFGTAPLVSAKSPSCASKGSFFTAATIRA